MIMSAHTRPLLLMQKTRLYNTVKELADANRNTEKLRVSDRARKLIEHWNVYLPGIRVLAKDF